MAGTITHFKRICGGGAVIAALFMHMQAAAQVSLGHFETTYSQNFNSLPPSSSATWVNNTYYIPGWTVQRTVTSATTITAGTGSSNTGGLYSFGSSGAVDRALGSINSANAGEFTYNLLLENNTGDTLKELEVSYVGEQWRCGSVATGEQSLTFSYAIASRVSDFNLSPKSTKGWVEVPEMRFRSKVHYVEGKTVVNGNLPENRERLSATLRIEVPEGHFIMLRWKDADEPEMDHGLAIDDVTVSWQAEEKEFIAMPVELTSFEGKATHRGIELAWATASERDNDFFVVERGLDGQHFEAIGKVQGSGTINYSTKYSYFDSYSLGGAVFYRLKQIDTDGSFAYSKVISVKVADRVTGRARAYPTLATDVLHIEVPPGRYSMYLSDQSGRRISEFDLQAVLSAHTLDVSLLRAGNYILVLLNEEGQKQVIRFLKR